MSGIISAIHFTISQGINQYEKVKNIAVMKKFRRFCFGGRQRRYDMSRKKGGTVKTLGAAILAASSAVGKKEKEGPLGDLFDFSDPTDRFGQKTWERSESEMQRIVFSGAAGKLGIGEEDIVYLVLPYVRSAREGVLRLGALLEQYGTYESNGIAFNDENEVWWLETIGGHHWIAKRVPDDAYVVMPNQLGIDQFDLEDALGAKKNHLCSADLDDFIENNHLDLSWNGVLNPRDAFGSHDDSDHVYNTPRAWFMLRYLNPHSKKWDGPNADYTPRSDDLPWCMVPEKKITPEDVKYVLSSHYQGTLYDPYGSSQSDQKGAFRSIGINRNDFMALIQMRPDQPEDSRVLEWIAFASNAFNVMVPFYANVTTTPAYLSNTTGAVSTDNFYWNSRMIAAMADAAYSKSVFHIERYQLAAASAGHANINTYDAKLRREQDASARAALREQANEAMADTIRGLAADTLDKVLYELSCQMKNCYSRSDA